MKKNLMNTRIDSLDYIRGFALLGIILINILLLLNINIPEPDTIDATYQRFLYLFVEGRFYSIFSFLFGVGFYIFITRVNEKGKKGYVLYLRRIAILLAFGAIHSLFQPGEALMIYAICGLIVLPFYKVNKHINLTISLLLFIVFSIIGVKFVFPLILLGLACGQYQVFENLSQKTKKISLFTLIMFGLSAIGLYIQFRFIPEYPFQTNIIVINKDGTLDETSKFLKAGVIIGPILSAFYIGILLLLLQSKVIQKLLSPLKYYGRMALTNYLGQTVFILLADALINFTEKMTYMQTLYVCLTIYIIQIIFSIIWLRFFKMGPLEWIWRMITYWKAVPLLKDSNKA